MNMKRVTETDKRTTLPVLSGALSAAVALTCMAAAPAEVVPTETMLIGTKQVRYFSNRPIGVRNAEISRAVIVVHGSGRKVEDYFGSIVDNIPSSPDPSQDWRRRTIVLAPFFQEKADAQDRKREAWWKDDWVTGGHSGGVSSYEVIDTLVARLRNGTFPNLRWVVITGHSAGASSSSATPHSPTSTCDRDRTRRWSSSSRPTLPRISISMATASATPRTTG